MVDISESLGTGLFVRTWANVGPHGHKQSSPAPHRMVSRPM